MIRSEDLFAGERTVLIEHAGEQYRLLDHPQQSADLAEVTMGGRVGRLC